MKTVRLIALVAFASIMLIACNKNKSNELEPVNIVLSASPNLKKFEQGNEIIKFTVKNEKGKDITEYSNIYIDGKENKSKSLKTDKIGKYKIEAKYHKTNTATLEIEVIANTSSTTFAQHALIEDYTGTWCGWCPRVLKALEKLEAKTKNVVVVAVHSGDGMANKELSSKLIDIFGISGFPSAIINRHEKWDSPETENISQVSDLVSKRSRLGIAIESKIDASEINATVKIKSTSNTLGKLKLAVVILENKIKADQGNYTSYFGGKEIITDFSHNHVLRSYATELLGDDIPDNALTSNKVYTKNFKISIPKTVENKDNIELVAIVVKSDKSVINARQTTIGENQKFEEK